MALAQTLTEWAHARGLGTVELDPDGGVQLVAGDELAVDIDPAGDGAGFSLTAAVGPLPQDGRGAVMEELLMANLAGLGTGGASLALDTLRDEIVLCRAYHTDALDVAVFDHELARFANALQFWRDRHRAGRLGAGPDGSAEGDGATASDLAPNGPGIVRI